jgi:succinyl-CoA synthetase beta subunit/citryl-CoA synthetase large subunit
MSRILEHHALELFERGGIAVPSFRVAASPEEAAEATRDLGGASIVKALIPAGGRGKAGAIRRADLPEQAAAVARELLGRTILHFPVERVLVSAPVAIEKELFVAITFDSMCRRPVVLFSALGGIEIEQILARDPGQLIQRDVAIRQGLPPFAAREIAEAAGLRGRALVEVGAALAALCRLFRQLDAQTVEVNPLAITPEGRVIAPSGIIVLDDQAAFRHPELEGMADPELTNGWRPFTPLERRMREIDRIDPGSAIRFNELEDGDIAFMVTGGGAGLLAFDAILRAGGRPATTFDITPGRVEEKMYLATKAILSRPGLKGLIAGGNISNFIPIDVKVRGVMRALKELRLDPAIFPVVFRFDGPAGETAKALAAELPGIEYRDGATSIEDAVRRIVERTATP